MKSTLYIVSDYTHNIHNIYAVSLLDLFQKATDLGIEVFDYEVAEGEDFA